MKNKMKKFIIGLMVFSLIFSATGAAFANEESDIRDEIAALEKLLAGIAAQLGGNTTTSPVSENTGTTTAIAGIPANFTFTRNLRLGDRGVDVRYLQIVLNSNPDTRLAQTGVGSPGRETEYFGSVTQNAVRRFQSKYSSEVLAPIGLTSATGVVGTQTRAKLNSLLVAGVTPGVPAPQPSDKDFSEIIAMLAEITASINSIRQRVEAIEKPHLVGGEGTLSAEVRATIRNVEVAASQTKDVAEFRIKAEDSDIILQRIDVYFGKNSSLDSSDTVTATTVRTLLDNMSLYVDGKKVAERELNRNTVLRDTEYIRFSGLDIKVPKDGHKDVVIRVTGAESSSTATIFVGFKNKAIRGIDAAGLTVESGTAAVARDFKFTGEETGNLEIKRHTATPEEGGVMVSDSSFTEVDLLRFTLKALESDIDLEELNVLLSLKLYDTSEPTNWCNTGDYRDLVGDAMLYEGDRLLDVSSVEYNKAVTNRCTVTFAPDLFIGKNATKDLTVVVDVRDMEAQEQMVGLKAEIKAAHNDKVGFDTADGNVFLKGDANGYYQALYVVAPHITNIKTSIKAVNAGTTSNPLDLAEGYIRFDLTALGGDIYLSAKDVDDLLGTVNMIVLLDKWGGADNKLDWVMLEASGTYEKSSNLGTAIRKREAPAATSGDSFADYSGEYYVVRENEKATFEVSFETLTSAEGRDRALVEYFFWIAGADYTAGTKVEYVEFVWTKDDFVEDLRTNQVTLRHTN